MATRITAPALDCRGFALWLWLDSTWLICVELMEETCGRGEKIPPDSGRIAQFGASPACSLGASHRQMGDRAQVARERLGQFPQYVIFRDP